MRFLRSTYSFVLAACWAVTPARAQTRGAGPHGTPSLAPPHVAGNLNCGATRFSQLQIDMTQKGMSLGRAIQAVTHSSTSAATKHAEAAEREADDDLEVESTTTRTPTFSTGLPRTERPAATKSRNEIGTDLDGR
jgi:hypothetical protein